MSAERTAASPYDPREHTGYDPENRKRANRALLDTLAALWDEHPHQRFGQLVMNLSRVPGGFADIWEWNHSDFQRRIQEVYEEWNGGPSDGR